jgi:hypothetical protein
MGARLRTPKAELVRMAVKEFAEQKRTTTVSESSEL